VGGVAIQIQACGQTINEAPACSNYQCRALEVAAKAACLFPAGSFRRILEGNIHMKHILVVAMLVAASTIVFGQPTRSSAHQKGNDEQAIRALLNELYTALGHNDVAALDRVYADDYTLVSESGVLSTKAQRLAWIKSGELKYESAGLDEVNVRLYGHAAVGTWRGMVKGQFKGQDIGGQLRVTGTFVKIKGHWKLVAAHISRITGQ
jgi:ketosteroid isomerase-like protein